MPEYLSPGVYVEEFEIGAKPIDGISTSTLGIIGETERGPLAPTLVTNFEEYKRIYGGHIQSSYLTYAIDGFFTNGGQRCYVSRVVGVGSDFGMINVSAAAQEAASPASPVPSAMDGSSNGKARSASSDSKREKASSPVFMLKALGPGDWGNRIGVKISTAGLASMNPKLFKLTICYWKDTPPSPIVDPTDQGKEKDPNRRTPVIMEIYDNLSVDPASSDNYEKRINNISVLVSISRGVDSRPADMEFTLLSGGKNGSNVTLDDYKGRSGAEPGSETGLLSLKEVDGISILLAPNEGDIAGLTNEIVNHCEVLKNRFAILQAPQSAGPIGNLMPPTDSKYAAYYYPWIKVIDPLTQNPKLIPPGGHVAGVYARSDTERGVHKAPANEVLRGVSGIQFNISKPKQDILNPRGINCIRAFPGRGIRIWGGRTISSDPLWKYINVRRLFLFLEGSIENGTQWVVFEPNNEKLWDRVVQTISQFLTGVWKTGALMGLNPADAFFVKCGRSTMSQDDIDNGRLVCIIGVAPTKPAEFVIFRIAQWQGGSAATE